MCGRFARFCAWDVIVETFGVSESPAAPPRYNIAPGQEAVCVRVGDRRKGREAAELAWGLIPSWAGDPAIGQKLINARSETVDEKPSFKNAFERRRLLVPADGFYEWRKDGRGRRPYFIRMSGGRPFAMAGLWERWEAPDGGAVETFALLTCAPNELVARIHNRMPVILDSDNWSAWLDPEYRDRPSLKSFLKPFPANEMKAYAVGDAVNNPSNDSENLILESD